MKQQGPVSISAGESGFLARTAAPVLAALLGDRPFRIDACGSLLHRPALQLSRALAAFGAGCTASFPLQVSGPLRPGRASVDGSAGSQPISGLMFALPLLESPSVITVSSPRSVPYLRLTADILLSYGIRISMHGTAEDELVIDIPAPQRYTPCSCSVPDGDWSAAAPLMVAAAVRGAVLLSGLREDSLQADRAIVSVLHDAGAFVRQTPGGWLVRRSPLHGFTCDLSDSPDIIPAAAVLAAWSEGTSRIYGTPRLRTKESDREAAVCTLLKTAGVPFTLHGDSITIYGTSYSRRLASSAAIESAVCPCCGDHRMVMAALAAGLVPDDLSPLSKSLPEETARSFAGLFQSSL